MRVATPTSGLARWRGTMNTRRIWKTAQLSEPARFSLASPKEEIICLKCPHLHSWPEALVLSGGIGWNAVERRGQSIRPIRKKPPVRPVCSASSGSRPELAADGNQGRQLSRSTRYGGCLAGLQNKVSEQGLGAGFGAGSNTGFCNCRQQRPSREFNSLRSKQERNLEVK
jgi:hypothetical protein